jgi:hypothetical protein
MTSTRLRRWPQGAEEALAARRQRPEALAELARAASCAARKLRKLKA